MFQSSKRIISEPILKKGDPRQTKKSVIGVMSSAIDGFISFYGVFQQESYLLSKLKSQIVSLFSIHQLLALPLAFFNLSRTSFTNQYPTQITIPIWVQILPVSKYE